MELEHIVKKAVRRWAEKIASKRAQRQARMALPNGSDLSKRKAGRLGVAGSVHPFCFLLLYSPFLFFCLWQDTPAVFY